MYKKKFLLSVGGSLISLSTGVDTDFLKKFTALIRKQVQAHPDRQFFLVTGGGAVCRQYQQALRDVRSDATNVDIDWIGTRATQYNGYLLQLILKDIAYKDMLCDYSQKYTLEEPVVVGAGWEPGHSSDIDAVILAEQYDVHTIINLSNIDYVYDKNPKEFPDAKPLTNLTWTEMKQIVGGKDTWIPGKNTPFDPVATDKAANLGLQVIIANGNNIDNLEDIFESKPYIGTTIAA